VEHFFIVLRCPEIRSRIIYTHRYCVQVIYTVYMQLRNEIACVLECEVKGGYTLVTLPRIVTPYRDSVDGTRARVTYQKLVTR
jgi:hypothetical protein